MTSVAPATWLAEALAPLGATLGDRLRFTRSGRTARWTYNGHAAEVEMRADDRIVARFCAPAAFDAVSRQLVTPVYVRYSAGYALDRGGCERMVADMAAFFAGVREPRFTFVDA